MSTIALVTAGSARGLDADEPLLLAALEATGARVRVVGWDDSGVDWTGFDLAVVRSAWDYASRRPEFLAWARRTASTTVLRNDAEVLAWNTDKRYLRALRAAGVPVVPSRFFEPGEDVELPAGEYVVKPAISAGAKDTARGNADSADRARALVADLHAHGRTVLVQPYLAGVDRDGETAVVFVDGVFSHGARKGPLLVLGADPAAGLFAPEEMSPRGPSPDERAVAEAALGALEAAPVAAGDLLYARVDLVPDAAGNPVVLELELAEPSLFLACAEGAAERFAAAILRHVPRRTRG